MNDVKLNVIYLHNLRVIAAMLEVSAAVMKRIEGTDEVSSQVRGEEQTQREYQEYFAAQAAKAFGA
mgnify:CR=1 FL=1